MRYNIIFIKGWCYIEDFIRFFWIFMLGGFFGFLLETVWCIIRWRKIESRKGLIYGHFIPIYGISGIFIAMVVEFFKLKKAYVVFFATFVICAIVEYASSLFQEKCMGTSSWDYSDMRFNLNGRINLVYLIGFGLFGILWCKIYPLILKVWYNLVNDENILYLVTLLVGVFMIFNIFISCVATYRQKSRRKGIKTRNIFEEYLDRKYTDEYLTKVYANSKFVD